MEIVKLCIKNKSHLPIKILQHLEALGFLNIRAVVLRGLSSSHEEKHCEENSDQNDRDKRHQSHVLLSLDHFCILISTLVAAQGFACGYDCSAHHAMRMFWHVVLLSTVCQFALLLTDSA
jgi:hypothetical protein